jgi:hypothetical protein
LEGLGFWYTWYLESSHWLLSHLDVIKKPCSWHGTFSFKYYRVSTSFISTISLSGCTKTIFQHLPWWLVLE